MIDGRVESFSENHEFLVWLRKNNKVVYREFVEIDPKYVPIKEAARDFFDMTQATVVIPLVLNEELVGVVNLDKKSTLKRYNALDFNFLSTIKNQSAIAISNSLIYQDIEEQVRARTKELVEVQRQLIQAEKLATVGTLSGGVAHEINNPLTAILTNVQMLLSFSDDKDSEVDKESLEMIEEATQRCRMIVQKLMAYSKKPIESGEMSVVDLADVLKKVVNFLKYQLSQDDISIITNIEKKRFFVLGNHNELEQVLTNLILNARDAIHQSEGARDVVITLDNDNGSVIIVVKDEGPGIKKDILSKIFDPFFTTKEVGKGLGLGLSICQSIVEKHNGEIKLNSQLGRGTSFTVKIPEHI